MKADKQLDFYEFAGIVLPGAILIVGLAQSVSQVGSVITIKEMTLGTLGLFLILAYAGGHLVQTLGNFLENLWWYFPGMPTDWARTNKGHLLSASQRSALEDQIPKKLLLRSPFSLTKLTAKEWVPITRQIYAAVAAANHSSRVDIFNGNYGLNRGLASALLVVAVVVLIEDRSNWGYALGLTLSAILALYRMHRFGRHYAREMFVQFLQLPLPNGAQDKKTLIVDSSTQE